MGDDPVREMIERELVIERDGWARERVDRVTARLQRDVPEAARLETLVVWSSRYAAFTGPGRTIYVSRRLLERMPDDEAAAMVVAHELSHHRLGHVPMPSRLWRFVPLASALRALTRWIAGPDNERDADLLAIELCMDAGYDVERCVVAFALLEQVVLDYGDVDTVLGPESPHWWDRPSHEHLRARVAAVRAHADAVRRGERLPLDVSRERARRRYRRMLAIAGGAAATVALLVLRRRL